MSDCKYLEWILYSNETVLLKDSDDNNHPSRPSSPEFQTCYRSYDIYDTIRMSIVYDQKNYGLLTLYRTKEDGVFSLENIFYLRALSKHLNYLFYLHLNPSLKSQQTGNIDATAAKYNLTKRETEILLHITNGKNNQEITNELHISEYTLQKHLQNIYRKCNVSARWDLLKL